MCHLIVWFLIFLLCCDGVQQTVEFDYMFLVCQIHGILNVVSWGILFPVGVIIARYLRTFESADPIWFYLHVFCQISAYAIGVAGWGTGLKLGSQSQGIEYTAHRNIGISLFSIATVQVMSICKMSKLGVVCRNQVVFFNVSFAIW